MPHSLYRSLAPLLIAPLMLAGLLLGGCKGQQAAADHHAVDPELAAALNDPVMTDPDLSGPNRRGAALTGNGVPEATIPLDEAGPDAANAARAEALALVGGSLRAVPPSSGSSMPMPGETAMQTAANVLGYRNACLGKVDFTTAWAARLPEPFTVYPRGHTQEAAGSDKDGCHLRVVNFRVAVSASDVLGFYTTRARQAGYTAETRAAGKAQMLTGSKDAARYAVIVRPMDGELTEVDLITR